MIKAEIGKYEVKVEKVGRKWIQIEANCKAQLAINNLTNGFEAGNVYYVYAKKKTDSNRYGTTIQYFPIDQETFKEKIKENDIKIARELLVKYEGYSKKHDGMRDKILSHSHQNEEIIDKLNNIEKLLEEKEETSLLYSLNDKAKKALLFDSSLEYKLNYIINKILEARELTVAKSEREDFSNILSEMHNRCYQIIEKIQSIDKRVESFYRLKKTLNIENKEFEEKIQEECDRYLLEYMNKTRIYYNNGYAVSPKKLDILKYASKHVQNRLKSFEKEIYDVNVEPLRYLISNIFNIRTPDSMQMLLNKLGIEYEDDRLSEYRAYDGNIYILSYRLTPEIFKLAVNECGLVNLRGMGYELSNKYVSTDPYMLLFKLVENRIIEPAKCEGDNFSDFEKIKLWSNNIMDPFTFRKEIVDEELYYFVTKEMTMPSGDKYNAYYIVGWDEDTKRGFSHRIPWKDRVYESMSIKEIIYKIFRYNEGYKRIQGDVIAKEYDIEKNLYVIEKIYRNININGTERKVQISPSYFSPEREVLASQYVPTDIDNSEICSPLSDGRIDYRKNLYVEGKKINNTNEGFAKCYVYCNNKRIFSSETPVRFNFNGNGEKLKYGLYYENITYESNCEIEVERIEKYRITDSNNKAEDLGAAVIADNCDEAMLGDHRIMCREIKNNIYRFGSKEILAYGTFKITHSEHSSITYGDEDKVYKVTLATRHRSKECLLND